MLTESEPTQLVSTFDLVALFRSNADATNHHGPDAHSHDLSELRAVDGNDLPHVLAVHV